MIVSDNILRMQFIPSEDFNTVGESVVEAHGGTIIIIIFFYLSPIRQRKYLMLERQRMPSNMCCFVGSFTD